MSPSSAGRNVFEATASALGYAYQLRHALCRAWEALRVSVDWEIGIEAADDVEFVGGAGLEYRQLKHRAAGSILGNASPDLWKTVRIWCAGVNDGSLDVARTQLQLITTASAAPDTVASYLGPNDDSRNVDLALAQMRATRAGSKNKDNDKAFAAWDELKPNEQEALVRAITIHTDAPDIQEVNKQLISLAVVAVDRSKSQAFLENLEGWWFQQSLRMMGPGDYKYLSGEQLDAYISELRGRLSQPDDLPVATDIEVVSVDTEAFVDRIFVEQIKLTRVRAERIADAVRDYMRAYTQRSRWVRQGLLYPDELHRYETRLVEEWRYTFNQLVDDLPEAAAEDEKIRVAREIYRWVENAGAPPIRSHCSEKFLIRGSLHMLADGMQVGWHPDFVARLMALLEPVPAR